MLVINVNRFRRTAHISDELHDRPRHKKSRFKQETNLTACKNERPSNLESLLI
jgi:hypothetical protein